MLITVAAVHAVAAVFVPWLWIGFLAVILLFATGTIGHSRSSQDRYAPATANTGHGSEIPVS